MGAVDERLAELGLDVPEVAPPVAAYVPAVLDGSRVYVSGQVPMVDGVLAESGHVGEGPGLVTPERAKELAAICALNAIAAIRSRWSATSTGSSGSSRSSGFVASDPSFTGQPGVVNGASELFGGGVRRGRRCTPARPSASRRCRSGRRSRSRSSSTCGTDRGSEAGSVPCRMPGGRVASSTTRSRATPGSGCGPPSGWRRPTGSSSSPGCRDGDARARRGVRAGGLRAVAGGDRWRSRRRRWCSPAVGSTRSTLRCRCRRPGWRSWPRRWGSTTWRRRRRTRRPPCARSRRSAGCGCRWPTCAAGPTG